MFINQAQQRSDNAEADAGKLQLKVDQLKGNSMKNFLY